MMKKFLKYCLLFNFPIIMLGTSSEFLLRNIPNDYHYKKEFLDKNSDNIKVLFLGSSHAFYGINPAYFDSASFNASHISQTLDYDFKILKKYENHWDKLKCIAIPISYFTLFQRLETGIEYWRVKNYTIYYGMSTGAEWTNHSELFSNKLLLNLRRLDSFYLDGKSEITCSSLGWGVDYNSKHKNDLMTTGINAARRHSSQNNKDLVHNLKTLYSIIYFAQSRGVKVFLYTPPAYYSYTRSLDSLQLNRTLGLLEVISAEFNNVMYRNFLYDKSFSANDYYDADHLNEIGALKLTSKIDRILNPHVKSSQKRK